MTRKQLDGDPATVHLGPDGEPIFVTQTDEIRVRVSVEPVGPALPTVTKVSAIKTLAGPPLP